MCTYPVQPVCTSLSSLLFILLFIKSHILFLHILLILHILFCTFLYSITHFTLYFSFLPIYICSCVVLLLYNFYSLHCPLSGPDLIYISLLIIPCIIYHVTNKETLNLDIMLKPNIFVETNTFQDSLHLLKIEILCNITNVFSVTFDKLNASLLNKSFHFFLISA